MRNYAIIIPAYRPPNHLLQYIKTLLGHNVAQIIVVNDGSPKECDGTFKKIAKLDSVVVINHEINQGKGVALKTAFSYFLENYTHLTGVVTADADGQHQMKDIFYVGAQLEKDKNSFILGMRKFQFGQVPFRSWLGNKVTAKIFQILFGVYIPDTQTGLRGFLTTEIEWLLYLRGKQFEYEMNVLIQAIKREKEITLIDIETVYYEKHISHYNTYKDSIYILKEILRNYLERI